MRRQIWSTPHLRTHLTNRKWKPTETERCAALLQFWWTDKQTTFLNFIFIGQAFPIIRRQMVTLRAVGFSGAKRETNQPRSQSSSPRAFWSAPRHGALESKLWRYQFPETKIFRLLASRRMRGLVCMASRDKVDVDTFLKGIQYALEKLGKSKFDFERTTVSNFKTKWHEGSGDEFVDYSRAPCLGADQKARGLWERDWRQTMRATVCFSIEHEQARHAPRDAFYVNFICQLVFRWKCFGAKESNCCLECCVFNEPTSSSREWTSLYLDHKLDIYNTSTKVWIVLLSALLVRYMIKL